MMHLTRSILFMAGILPLTASAQLHTFKNGEVADADKINQNFAAIDQSGPVIDIGDLTPDDPPVSNGLQQGSVAISISDPSGLFSYGFGSEYSFSGPAPWYIDRETLVFNSDTNVSLQRQVSVGLNETASLVLVATDLHGNRTIEKVDFSGPISTIKGGIYSSESSMPINTDPCSGLDQWVINVDSIELSVSLSNQEAYPSIEIRSVTFCDITEGSVVQCFAGFDSIIVNADSRSFTATSTGPNGIYTRSATASVNVDSTEMTVEVAQTFQCPSGEIKSGPFVLNLNRQTQ